MKDADCTEGIDWSEQTLQVVSESAKFGVEGAIAELDKRRRAMEKLGTVTPKFSVIEDED
jgi:hypothetical protein